jgi:hypothetical protein
MREVVGAEFEAALLRSAKQAVDGKHARVHTPEQIKARRRGRPVGSTAEVRNLDVSGSSPPSASNEG